MSRLELLMNVYVPNCEFGGSYFFVPNTGAIHQVGNTLCLLPSLMVNAAFSTPM